MWDWDEIVLWLLGATTVALIAGMVGFGGVAAYDEVVLGRRSFEARAACAQQRMTPMRKFLSTDVVCVPVVTRQDTTTLNVNGL